MQQTLRAVGCSVGIADVEKVVGNMQADHDVK